MVREVPLVIMIVSLVVSLGAGIGAGYAIKANQAGADDPEADACEAKVVTLEATIADLEGQVTSLTDDLTAAQTTYESLLETYNDALDEYRSLRTNYAILDKQRQALQSDFDLLYEACGDPTVDRIIELTEQVIELQNRNGSLEVKVVQLERQLTPGPERAIKYEELIANPPKYKSVQWKGRDYELQLKLEQLAEMYHSTHTYVPGGYGGPNEFDCNDMAVDMWNMLLTNGITSVIVIGNRDMVGETFEESDHAWLYALNGDGQVIYVEPTIGEVMYGRLPDGSTNPAVLPYRDGYIYEKPSDLRLDLKHWW